MTFQLKYLKGGGERKVVFTEQKHAKQIFLIACNYHLLKTTHDSVAGLGFLFVSWFFGWGFFFWFWGVLWCFFEVAKGQIFFWTWKVDVM